MTGASSSPADLERAALSDFQAGRWEDSIARFLEARELYSTTGQASKAAEMANNASVALLQTGKAEQALELVRPTPEIFASAGDELMEAKAYGNLAAAMEGAGDLNGAEAAYRRAAESLGRLGDRESQSQTLRALSQLLFRRGRTLDAVLIMQSALESGARPSLRDRFLRWLVRLPLRIQGR